MKILHVAWLGTIGGLEKYVSQLSAAQRNLGHEVEVCILHKTGPVYDEIVNAGIPTHFIGMQSGSDFIGALRLRNVLLKNDYDIIHVHDRNILSNLILLLYFKGDRVFTEHGGALIGPNPLKHVIFYLVFSKYFKAIIANSGYIKNIIINKHLAKEQKVQVVYNGIDLNKYHVDIDRVQKSKELGFPLDRKIIGIVGRIVPAKGIDIFIEAAQLITSKSDYCLFVVVGDGIEKSKYENIVKTKYQGLKLLFLGWRTDIEEIMKTFDLFLFTSKWEPFGIVLLEAMASGVPIVGFDIPGANEVVEKNVSAILVKPYDISKLVDAVLEVNSNSMLYNTLSNNGRSRAKNNFSIETNVNKVLQIYRFIHKQL